MWLAFAFLLALGPRFLHGAYTDEIQDADPAQSGYLSNHNLDPAVVKSSSFGILWKNTYAAKERWYAKPLVYTPPGASQLVFTASAMNVVRTLDAVNGTLLKSRTIQPPFLMSDIGCGDIPDYIGIIGTPIIDPESNTAYFFSKGYKNGEASGGVANGIYKFYAVDVLTLEDKPGFPVLVDGKFADNDKSRYFLGGTVLQRPSLAMIGGKTKTIIGTFGGHCDLFNYTGMIVAVGTAPGAGVVSLYAMEATPGAPAQTLDIMNQQGGKAGIWHAGMGLAVDGNKFFVVTGNGQGHENGDVPASGRTPLSTLDEVVASFSLSDSGKISLVDYFEPYEYVSMDAGDRDLGSSGVTLLDPGVFKGTGVARIAAVMGKNGKAYIMNANNLGGFKQGVGGSDNIIQTIITQGSVFAGAGSYPLEGGYLYFTPVGNPTLCYKIGADSQGLPLFTLVGQTLTKGAGRVGIGTPTITSYKGKAGTGILWITDPDAGLRAFNAVPVNGILSPISLPPTGGLNKFLRPAFGDGRLYVTTSNGNIICMGSPVALPLKCSSPVDFGETVIGSTKTLLINCTTLIPLTSINGCVTGVGTWKCSNSTLPSGPLAVGASFSFPVSWELAEGSVEDAKNASFGKVIPGVASTSLNIYTSNAVPKYSNVLPISLTGTTVSKSAFFDVVTLEINFGGLVVGSDGAKTGLSSSLILSNIGAETLTFLGSAWANSIDSEDGPVLFDNITDGNLGSGFSSSSLPKVNDILTTGESITVPLEFLTNKTGTYSTFVEWWTTGGSGYVLLAGSASTPPVANISISTSEGYWDSKEPLVMDFGNVVSGTTVSRSIRICNNGGSVLMITKSKPPSQRELFAPNPSVDLHEGQTIDVNACALGQISIVAAPLGVNRPDHSLADVWILNVDDITFGVRDVSVRANIVTQQVGPLLSNGSAEYLYLGCYNDGKGRQFQKSFSSPTNENGQCQNVCFKAGYRFAGTEYHTECWCGNNPPSVAKYSIEAAKECSFSCPGNTTQACGGPGTYVSVYYDRLKYVPGPEALPMDTSMIQSTSVSSSTYLSSSSVTSSNSGTPTSPTSTSSPTVTSSNSVTSTSQAASNLTSSSVTSLMLGPTNAPISGGYSYAGCYSEAIGERALSGKSLATDVMTVETCRVFCEGFVWFGLEYSRECYCGNDLNVGSVLAAEKDCSSTCRGNQLELCGGSSRLSMYNSSLPVLSATTDSKRRTETTKLGASNSGVSSSSLPTASSQINPTSISVNTVSAPSTTTITMVTAAPTLLSPTISASILNGFTSMGCFSDPAGGPFSGHNMPKLFSNDSMTPSLCISSAIARLSAVPAATYAYVGLEYGRECYAHTARPRPEPTALKGPKACTIKCKGDSSQSCGGRNMLNVWMLGGVSETSGIGATITSTLL
ncbi:hypothetical protein GLAREA_01578 [Glarea lozoyensis ATCC 20868]|uniref:WSC domain-containing protein n=1 Tax=Glarea lozoyensis (strain ATCC 20868 / MF5171) TaxID=1116229 RepID=S3D0V9_GLAL2|nr:uncharacterized protein GLAREA_01578 [Glarea lozoyensis ATCC 20868]EPE25666.1 hypothetical protein GLAREA_01578 [Glarea lozoyensis ATCC 20868]